MNGLEGMVGELVWRTENTTGFDYLVFELFKKVLDQWEQNRSNLCETIHVVSTCLTSSLKKNEATGGYVRAASRPRETGRRQRSRSGFSFPLLGVHEQ